MLVGESKIVEKSLSLSLFLSPSLPSPPPPLPHAYYVFLAFFCAQHREGGHHMNIELAWEQGVIGRGVVVSILDDGLEYTHPDLHDNYVSLSKIISFTRIRSE